MIEICSVMEFENSNLSHAVTAYSTIDIAVNSFTENNEIRRLLYVIFHGK